MSKERFPLRDRVEVEWVDSAHCGGWASIDHKRRIQGVVTCRTVGYVLERTPEVLKLVMSQSNDAQDVADGMSIPRSVIKRVRRLGKSGSGAS